MIKTNGPISIELQNKLSKLEEYLRDLGSLAVGFSGGVDSSFLLEAAHQVLGDKAIAVTAIDSSIPERELNEAKEFCDRYGIRHITIEVDPLSVEAFRKNSPDRCYHCKKMIFSKITEVAKENDIEYVAEGSNIDDMGDYRPGLKAVNELSVKSPLREAELNKADIRTVSKAMGLPTWSKPSYACLASRFVYNEEITEEKLKMIDQAESFLIENGFHEERVRMHGNIARIEVPEKDIPRLAEDDLRKAIFKRFKEIGFTYVTLDMCGYRTGSMNEVLDRQ